MVSKEERLSSHLIETAKTKANSNIDFHLVHCLVVLIAALTEISWSLKNAE